LHIACGVVAEEGEEVSVEGMAAAQLEKAEASAANRYVPSESDRAEIARYVDLDQPGFGAYSDITLRLARGGRDSPLFKALMRLNEDEDAPLTIDRCVIEFSQTEFRARLTQHFSPRGYARWYVALHYYQMVDALLKATLKQYYDKGMESAFSRGHDKNLKFVSVHREELLALHRQVGDMFGWKDTGFE
jgi:hypothetical protein